MKSNPITLSFSKDLEGPFLKDYFSKSLRRVRRSLILGIIFYPIFGIIDALIFPEVMSTPWLMRFVVVCLSVLGIVTFSFSSKFEYYMQASLAALMFVSGVGIVVMIGGPAQRYTINYAGLILILFFGYTFVRARFVWATLAGCLVVFVYEIAEIWVGNTPLPILITNSTILIGANIIGMFACYSLEFDARRQYFLAHLLEEAQAKEHREHGIANNRKKEEALRIRLENEQLLDAISSILIRVDKGGKVIYWNASAEKIFGIKAADAIGRPFTKCDISWDWNRMSERLAESKPRNHQTRLDDVPFKRQDGNWGRLGMTYTPLSDYGQESSGFLLMGADITERDIMAKQLAQARKLKSIGQLAAGIAHEINTPTQYIGDNTQFLNESFTHLLNLLKEYGQLLEAAKQGDVRPELINRVEVSKKEADLEYLVNEIPLAFQQSLDGIQRVTEIVGAMKEFSHPGSEDKKATDINRAISSTITMSRNEWKYVADVETDFSPNLPLLTCLESELSQVFLNLIINAAHAIGDDVGGKGTIKISTRQQGKWIEIRFADTGTGIPEEIQERIFDPFFTTKEVGMGTGQGLALAHNVVVEKHGGAITVETEMGRGTTFTLRLPISGASQGKSDREAVLLADSGDPDPIHPET